MGNQLTGRIIKKLEAQHGSGKNGAWIKHEIVIETIEQYPKKICIATWGDIATNMDSYKVGESIKAFINIESREYNERWYTEVRVWKIERTGNSSEVQQEKPLENKNQNMADNSDDLPF